ncbi:MAG: peptidoglycan DD-metalloendopeptidase family protein [Lachnospiraceae bacterium]|nr:peptidoglycan DD-metalloendopeptidase family protein [Lachnospiraceae bacterium]
MRRKRHKRKLNHIVIVTSNSTDVGMRQFLLKPGLLWTVILTLCIIIGVLIGYFLYEAKIWQTVSARNDEQLRQIAELDEQKRALETEVETLQQHVQILSDTVNEKVQSEAELTAQIENQSMPTEFPLTGSASMEESLDGENPICIFQASEGTTVIAAASGVVTAVNDDEEYGHSVVIDHGNGYVTIYRNQGETNIKTGDSVVQGTTLYIITNDNVKFGYQMMLDGEYINPVDMLAING